MPPQAKHAKRVSITATLARLKQARRTDAVVRGAMLDPPRVPSTGDDGDQGTAVPRVLLGVLALEEEEVDEEHGAGHGVQREIEVHRYAYEIIGRLGRFGKVDALLALRSEDQGRHEEEETPIDGGNDGGHLRNRTFVSIGTGRSTRRYARAWLS